MRREQLFEAISKKRAEMVKIGVEKGLHSEETITCSQELDKLLNSYHNLISKPDCTKSAKHINLRNRFLEYLRKQIHKYLVSA